MMNIQVIALRDGNVSAQGQTGGAADPLQIYMQSGHQNVAVACHPVKSATSWRTALLRRYATIRGQAMPPNC